MNKFWGRFVHAVAFAGVAFSQFSGLIPLKYVGIVGVVISAAQCIVGAAQHKSNEDGTPQTEAFKG